MSLTSLNPGLVGAAPGFFNLFSIYSWVFHHSTTTPFPFTSNRT